MSAAPAGAGQRATWGGVIFLTLALAGCSVLTANNRELLDGRAQLAAGDMWGALAAVSRTARNDLCATLDRALILAIAGRPAESNSEFDRALEQIREYERRATVSATEVGAGAGSLLLNDKVLAYQGEGFEKVLIHAYKARNYLMLGDEEAARVEIRNANMRQDEERRRHQDAIAEARRAGEETLNFAALSREIDRQFASSAAILSRLDNVYQNPFATYLSAVVYELNGEPGEAFVDLKNAYRMTPNALVAADLARLATTLRRQDELGRAGMTTLPAVVPTDAGNTLVLIENGLAPERVEIKFPIPEPDAVLFAAVPITSAVPTNLSEVEILDAEGRVAGRTDMMVDVEAMEVRNLRDKYPAMLVRQAIRLGAKAAAAHAVQREAGVGGFLLMSLFNAVTEQADLRAWYTLPRSIHVARVSLPPAEREVTLRLLDLSGQPMRQVTAPLTAINSHLRMVVARYIHGQVLLPTPADAAVARGSRKEE